MDISDVQELIQVLPEPVLVVTRSARILAFNSPFANLRAPGGLQGASLLDLVEGDRESVLAYLKACARTKQAALGSLTLQFGTHAERFVCDGGRLWEGLEEPWILLRFRRAPEAVQQFRMLSGKIDELNAEISRRRRAEIELREIQRTLEQRVSERTQDLERAVADLRRSNQSLEEFAYVASHDLNEPLRKIRVFADLLQEQALEQLKEDDRIILDRIQSAAERMQLLIQGLLDYSRISSRPAPPVDVDLNEVVREIIADLEVGSGDAHSAVQIGALPTVRADPIRMHQLFQNLLSNSYKFRRPGVPLKIRIESNGMKESMTEIRITDNGIGFEPEFAQRIFEPFQRLHSQHEFAGTGIGLTICRKIVEQHGGTLSAVSRPGAGTTFRILLPGR